MTDERHEKALEAAMIASFGDGSTAVTDELRKLLLAATTKMIAAYLASMDAVILPRELSDELLEEIHSTPSRAHERPMALKGHRLAQEFRKDEYRMLVSKAPNHFTNGE